MTEGRSEQVGGIALGLSLDTAGFSAGVSKAKAELASLEATPVRIRAEIAAPARAQELDVRANLSIDRAAIQGFRSQIEAAMKGLGDAGHIPIQITLGRINYGAIRSEIAAGIGEVPIKVTVAGGGRDSPSAIVAATVAESSGASNQDATTLVKNATRKRGLEPRAMGGPVQPGGRYIVGESGPEELTMHNRGGYVRPMHAGVGARAYRATQLQGGGTFGPGGQPERGYAVGLSSGSPNVVPAGDARGFLRAYHSVQRQGAPYVGTWLHEGEIHVDPADVLTRRRQANILAARNAQIAFYDITRGEEIGTQRRRNDPSPGQMGLGFRATGGAARGTRASVDTFIENKVVRAHADKLREWKDNLLAHAQGIPKALADSARDWYQIARAQAMGDLADFGKQGLGDVGIGAFAAASPGQPWPNNRAILRSILGQGTAPHSTVRLDVPGFGPTQATAPYGYGNWAKAAEIVKTGNIAGLSGPKVTPFFGNLSGKDPDAWTLDARQMRIASKNEITSAPGGGSWQRLVLEQAHEEVWPDLQRMWGLKHRSEAQAVLWAGYGRGEDLGNDWKRTSSHILIPRHPGISVPLSRAGGGFTHASEASALARLRQITDQGGRILPGFTDEAQSINLQIEQMRMANRNTFESPWARRMRESRGVAKEFRMAGGRARKETPFWRQTVRDSYGRLMPRAFSRDEGDPRYQQWARGRGLDETLDFLSMSNPMSAGDPGVFPGEGMGPFTHRMAGGISRKYVVHDPDGIHGRPSQYLAGLMEGLDVRVSAMNASLGNGRYGFDGAGNQIHDWYGLNARKGHRIHVEAEGADAERAHARIKGILSFDPYESRGRTYDPAERASGFADFDPGIGSEYKRLYHRLNKLATGGYIVGERGPELFVPKSLESVIPPDVMARLPKKADGGIVEIGKKPFSYFAPPEDGWIIPNHLRNRIPHAEGGADFSTRGPGGRFTGSRRRRPPYGVAAGEETSPRGPDQYPRSQVEAQMAAQAAAETAASAQEIRPRTPYVLPSEIHAASDALRRAPGSYGLTGGRSSIRSAAANIGSFFLGNRQATEQARLEAQRQRRDLTGLEGEQGRLEGARFQSEAHLHHLRDTQEVTPEGPEYDALTKRVDLASKAFQRDTDAVAANAKRIEHHTQLTEEAERKAQPGGRNIAQNLFGIGAGVAGYQIAQQGISAVLDAALPAAEKWIDMMTGFHSTASRVTTDIAKQTEALHGNADEALASAAATANLSSATLDYLSANLKTTVSVKAGAQAQQQAEDLFRAAYGVQQGKPPEGLYGGYGGIGGSSLFANQLGGGPGFTEQVYGGLEAIQSKAPKSNLLDNLSTGLTFATDTGVRNSVLNAQKEQGGGLLAGAGDALGLLGDAANLNVGGFTSRITGQANTGSPIDIGGLIGDIAGLNFGGIQSRVAASAGQPVAAGPYDATAGLSPQQVSATTARMKELTSAAQRGASAVADSLQDVTYSFAKSPQELKQAADAAAAAGDLQGYAGIMQTGVVARVGGQVVNEKQYQKVAEQTAVGAGIPDIQTLAAANAQQLRAQLATNAANVAIQTGVRVPAQLGMQLAANPLINPAAGVLPSPGSGVSSGFSSGASSDINSSLARANELQGQLNKQADAGLKIAHDTVAANGGNVKVFDDAMTSVKAFGTEIAGLQTQIDFTQSTLSAKQFANQMFFLNRQLSDAQGLAGQAGGANNLGALQRQSFMIGREQQSLGMGLQQRQITTAVAVAGFQAPGESPEERYARREEALAQAKIQQRQLNLNRQQFGVQGQIFNVSAQRGVGDAQRGIAIATAEHDAAGVIAAKSKEIAAAQANQAQAFATAQAQLDGGLNNLGTKLSAAAELMAQVPGTTLSAAMTAIDKVLNGKGGMADIAQRYETALFASIPGYTATGPTQQQQDAKKTGSSGLHAAGFLGTTRGAMSMTVGEAGSETVAILRNPRQMMIGTGGGGGGGVTVIVTGNTFSGREDEARLVQRITRAVEQGLGRKGQLMGLRGPAH
jgi:phosphotransferase system HPr-like phosphotransfer protein